MMATRAIYCVGLGLILFGCASGIGSGRTSSQSSPTPTRAGESASGPDLPAFDGPSFGDPESTSDSAGDRYAAHTNLTERTTRLPTAVQRSSGFRGSYRSQPAPAARESKGSSPKINETNEPSIGPGRGYVELDPPPDDGN